MKPAENEPPFGAGFMDDYFAEAEEHIVTVRRSLLTLEEALGSELPATVLEDLFRSCHSLKGISAMVELREAELVAHHMESCLRAVKNHQVALTPVNFEALVGGGRTLEAVVAAHRAGTPLPDVEEPIRQLRALAIPDESGVPRDATPPESGQTPRAGLTGALAPRWKVTFVPSPELVARGVKVDTVRTRLLEIGQVQRVVPKVTAGGGISFEFEVETREESKLSAWREDGITYEPMASGAADVSLPQGVAVAGGPTETAAVGTANFVRVDLARLEDLMRLVGDMVVARARLADTLERVEAHVPFREWRALQEHNAALERHLRDLREGVMRVRLVPVGEIFRRMPFVVRDLARDSGKKVRLDLAGGSTEIDKFLIERMMDPVIHLVRNAISHGIEAPEQRVAAGKPPEGVIRLGASTSGESIVVEISDDGAGIDVPAVAARARAAGLAVPDDSRSLLDLLCASGFSTREEADRASGRGVGMAVVRSAVRELGGVLALDSEPGRGTTFRVTLPLTLAITDAIIAQVGDQVFAVPQSAVREVIEVDATALRAIERNELLTYRGGTLPILRLSRLFAIESEARPRFHAIVVGTGLAAVGLMVDRITGQREIVVKTITDPLLRVDGISGATELGDGRLVLILDATTLSQMQTGRQRPSQGVRV